MDWDVPYTASPLLTITISRDGKLMLMPLSGSRGLESEPDVMPVLLGFAAGATPRAVLARLQEEWEIEGDGFEEVVSNLMGRQILKPSSASFAPVNHSGALGFGSIRSHLPMLRDSIRVLSYRSAIERHARGKTVVEIGCGTGILSLFAAKAGAKKVIAIEETGIAEVARRMFEANGCSDVIELRNANSTDVELDEPADLIIHEILGVDPLEENILPVLEDARQRLLRPGGRLLPFRLEISCAGVELEELEEERLRLEALELPRLYNLNFEPVQQAFAESSPRPARRWIGNKSRFDLPILSEDVRFLDIDFRTSALNYGAFSAKIPLRIKRPGNLGGVILYFHAHLDEDIQLTTSPFAAPTCWGWDVRGFSKQVRVNSGEEVAIDVNIGFQGGVQALSFELA